MGGYGSGRKADGLRKLTVEETLSLSTSLFKGNIRLGVAGYFVISDTNNFPHVLKYRFCREGFHLILWIYSDREEHQATIAIRMQQTRPNYGGYRWWFTCPLAVDGQSCKRRVTKLYYPPKGLYFGCRKCYRLSYISSQLAHKKEREIAILARELDTNINNAAMLYDRW